MSLRLWVGEYLSGDGQGAARELPADLLAAGVQMRDALVDDLLQWRATAPLLDVLVTYAQGPDAPSHARCASQALAPEAGEAALSFLPRAAQWHDLAWLVAPESDGMLEALARAVGPKRWIGCTPQAIALAGSKRATLARLAEKGIYTPLALEGEASAWVVKPDDGAGTIDTCRHPTRGAAEADLAERLARGAPATIEPWVDGEALSLSLLCRDGVAAELLSINRQRIEVDGKGLLSDAGVLAASVALDDPRAAALESLAQAVVLAVPGLRGFVGIDLVWHARLGPVAIEINPRLTCAYPGLSAVLGRNLAAEIVTAHLEDAHGEA
jgi:predicted ATP-grasp superfamily ATP-dependent carboligase